MAGFGSKLNNKNSKNDKTTKRNNSSGQSKKHKVQEDNLKYNSNSKVDRKTEVESLDNEVIDLPVYCSTPRRDSELDLFIIDSVTQSAKGNFYPYFIGEHGRKSFDMQIKSSALNSSPKDLVEDDSEGVVNLKRKL